MQTGAARPGRPLVDLPRLVAGFLQMATDDATVGEVRDREGLPLLLTLSSRVTGFTTIRRLGSAGPHPTPACRGRAGRWAVPHHDSTL
jgi:hypothetical protein